MENKNQLKKYLLIGAILVIVLTIILLFIILISIGAIKFLPEILGQRQTEIIEATTKAATEVVETEETVVITDTPTPTEAVTEEVVETEVETPTPEVALNQKGGWLDSIYFINHPFTDSAISQLRDDYLQVYAYSLSDQDLYQETLASGLNFVQSRGVFYDLTLNTAGPILNDGTLNPFSDQVIREAMNMLIDRDYIAEEIMGGMAVPKYLPIVTGFPNYERFKDVVNDIEQRYAYDLEQANEVITTRMKSLGATLEDEIWQYQGSPVEIKLLIRSDDERLEMGDYIANQLESIGFTTDRQYVVASQATPIWLTGDALAGEWHIYTGWWEIGFVDRDESDNFQFFYTPGSVFSFSSAWNTFEVSEEFQETADQLNNHEFNSIEEWEDLYIQALNLSIENSNRIMVIDRLDFWAFSEQLSLSSEFAGGIASTPLWARNIRYVDNLGGEITIGVPNILSDPWNPLAGSSLAFVQMVQSATGDFGVIPDPQTGLAQPQRIESAEVTVVEGLPVMATEDWVTLDFVPEIRVPDDSWSEWDPVGQVFISASERANAEGLPYLTANVKSVVTYPSDLFEMVKWHDGSSISMGDFVLKMILDLDPGYPDSELYDEDLFFDFDSYRENFKGIRIVSEDPLVIEYYTDSHVLDAENIVETFWPQYATGEGAWHMMALGILADLDNVAAFSSEKADAEEVEWLDYISGSSLSLLEEELYTAIDSEFIPYQNTLGLYISPEEAAMRYQNLVGWYDTHNNFWVGTGPYYLEDLDPSGDFLALNRFPEYPDDADKWERYSYP